jgi:hypothetical protein
MQRDRASRLAVLLAALALVAGCGTTTPTPAATPLASASPTAVPTPARSCPPPELDTGRPKACRDGITLTASWGSDPTVADGMGAAPDLPLEVRLTGLSPGEAVSLRAVATYRIGVLGCGRTPSVCYPGSGGVGVGPICAPTYAERATGSASASVPAVAATGGTAAATIRLPVSQTRRPCPADPSLPWYQRSAEWTGIRVTDRAHRLGITLPDWIIGP